MTVPEASNPMLGQKKERVVEVQGIATHLFEAGLPTSPPLLYLHGLHLGNLWLDYHNILASHFHIFAPDIPGFGLTERPDWMRDMSDYILYLRDLMNVLHLQKAHIAGHSLGGWMAVEFAIYYPERVHKLVLSNAVGIRVKGTPIADVFAMNGQELVAVCFEDLMAALPLMPPELNTDYLLQMYKERMTLASLAWNPSYDPKLQRRLAWLTCPTLIVWGARDRLIPPIYGEVFHTAIANSKLVTLEGTGHMPMFEKHEEWTRVIAQFLQEQEGTNV